MGHENNEQITFKAYGMEQVGLLPLSLEELIAEKHTVRVLGIAHNLRKLAIQ